MLEFRDFSVLVPLFVRGEEIMRHWGFIGVLLIGQMFVGGNGWSYEEVPVTNGGTLAGEVKLVGKVPVPKGYNLVTFPDPVYCGRISNGNGFRLLQPFQVGSNGEFRNVVVLIEGIKKGKPFTNTTERIEAIDCAFAPYVTVVRDEQEIQVVNMDPVLHDIQAYETSKFGARVLFNLPLPMSKRLSKRDLLDGKKVKNRAGKVLSHKIHMRKGRNVFVMQCGFHAYMESWGLAVKNPYFAISQDDGSFTIADVPPGEYKVLVWHPLLTKEFTVSIEANKNARLDIQIDAPKGRLYANEAQEKTRFGMELLGDSKIVPSVELQRY